MSKLSDKEVFKDKKNALRAISAIRVWMKDYDDVPHWMIASAIWHYSGIIMITDGKMTINRNVIDCKTAGVKLKERDVNRIEHYLSQIDIHDMGLWKN